MKLLQKLKELKPDVMVHACNRSYSGARGRRITGLRPAWAKVVVKPCLKNKIKTKGPGHNSSGTVLAYHMQEPQFKFWHGNQSINQSMSK
jgi:hypothetical protein